MKLSLNREQLKLIAIISMLIDHIAWGFVEFYSPLGQLLHVMGRFTIPIMCFFIAEGYRKTSDIKKYIERMISFGLITIIPFYIFFHEEYGYRVNFIFDLLFGLLALTLLESKLKKWAKVLLMIVIFTLSAVIGGWPILPILFVLIFYYGKSFKQKATLFILSDVAVVLFLVVAISLNNIYHFSHYEWVWWDKFYQLGFILALPLLYCYNGEKGKTFLSRYFFFLFYPLHFVVLSTIKGLFYYKLSAYNIDLMLHIGALLIVWIIIFLSSRCRPSRGQVAILIFLVSGAVYIFGFIMEIISSTPDNYHIAVLVEYFGEVMCFVGLLYFAQNLCKIRIPMPVYVAQIVFSGFILYSLLKTRENGFFYSNIDVDLSGAFPKLVLTYGPGFYMTISYILILSFVVIGMAIYRYFHGTNLDKRRIELVIVGIICVWLPYPMKLLGFTGGYEVPGIGIALAGVAFYAVMIKYGFLDSVSLASESALDHGLDGILVVGTDYMIQYHNKQVDEIFGEMPNDIDLRTHNTFSKILTGEKKVIEKNGRIYEFSIEVLQDNGYEQGKMIWIHDATEHHEAMRQIKEIATRDPLTKLYNRICYQEKIEEWLSKDNQGIFLMMDMDNFKRVNDKYGHRVGDEVLKALADVFNVYPPNSLIACRLGGDEFSAFITKHYDENEINGVITSIMNRYSMRLEELGYGGYTSLSIGAIVCNLDKPSETDFATIYNMADKVLYDAKRDGKNRFIMKNMK